MKSTARLGRSRFWGTAIVLALITSVASAKDDKITEAAEDVIEEAITLLEGRRATLELPADKEAVAAAVADLQRILKKSTDKPALDIEVTPAMVRKKLHGRTTFNAKTRNLSLVYDWSAKSQLLDFEQTSAKPTLDGNAVFVQGGASLKHVVDFNEVTIAVPIFVKRMQGTVLRTSGGIFTELGGMGSDSIYLGDAQERRVFIVPEGQRKGLQHVRLVVTPTSVRLDYGNENNPSRLGMARVGVHAGKVELTGGETGYQYGTLVMTGEVSDKWLAEAFEK